MSLPDFSRIAPEIALGFDDVLIEPAASSITPEQADLKTRFTRTISLNLPFVVMNVDADAAIDIARQGGIGVLPCNMAISKQADIVRKIKRAQSGGVRHVMTVTPETSIIDVLEYQQRHDLKLMPVVESGTQVFAGFIFLDENISYDDPEKTAADFISKDPALTIAEGTPITDAHALMKEKNADYAAIIDENSRFIGVITKHDRETSDKFPLSTVDEKGCLRVVACIDTKDYLDRVSALIDAGIDAIMIDVPHGHSKHVLDIVTYIRRQRSGHVDVIAGNIVTSEAALALIDAGADAVKIGMQLPQITAILHVSEACSLHNIPSQANLPEQENDLPKAFAAGVSTILLNEPQDFTPLLNTLRHAMSHTGYDTIKQFNTRPRFIRVSR